MLECLKAKKERGVSKPPVDGELKLLSAQKVKKSNSPKNTSKKRDTTLLFLERAIFVWLFLFGVRLFSFGKKLYLIFEVHIPSLPLHHIIKNIFYIEGFSPEHKIDRLLPDGNTEMIIDLTDDPKFIYDNDSFEVVQTCRYAWLSGMRTKPISIPSNNHKMIVINFHKGKAFPYYPFPANEITDYVVDADLVFGKSIFDIREQLLACTTVTKIFKLLEQFFLKLSGLDLNLSTEAKCVEFAIQSILKKPDTSQLKSLSQKIGYSQKHFINLFKKQVGITPKNFQKIVRFQKAIVDIDVSEELDWGAISFDCGYYDQAHFINDFKKFSGFTPKTYFRKKAELLNYIPVQ